MTETHLRQMGICSPDRLNEAIPGTTIIGAGGIGSSVAITLLKMGLEGISVYDFDRLEEHNIGNQFLPYRYMDYQRYRSFIDSFKVVALQRLADDMVPHRFNAAYPWAFDEHSLTDYLMISGVDSMTARSMIWNRVKDNCKWYIDGRMSAQQLDVYVVDMDDPQDIELYEQSLFSDDEGIQEPCTARGIIYTSLFAGAHIGNIVKQIAVGPTPPRRLVHVIEHHLVSTVRR